MKTAKKKSKVIKPGGVEKYISSFPKEIQVRLSEIRSVIQSVAPDAIETMSYFDMPGYSYTGFKYNGMFVWFSFKALFVRLHIRPKAIPQHKAELQGFTMTKAIVSFPVENKIPSMLVKKLVKASLKDMRSSV